MPNNPEQTPQQVLEQDAELKHNVEETAEEAELVGHEYEQGLYGDDEDGVDIVVDTDKQLEDARKAAKDFFDQHGDTIHEAALEEDAKRPPEPSEDQK